MANSWGKMKTVANFIFLSSKISADGDNSHEIKMLIPWKKSYDKPRQHIKKQRYYFPDKSPSSQSYGFSSSHVWMWGLDHKESWVLKNWCFWIVVLEKTLESLLVFEEIKPDNPKGNQSWISIEKTDGEAKAPILWPPDVRNWLIGKDPDAGKDWIASPTQWTWAWASPGLWWWTGKPGKLQSMGSHTVRHDWALEPNWTKVRHSFSFKDQVSFSFVAAVTIHSDFGDRENKIYHCFHFFLIDLPWRDRTRCHDLLFLNVEF